MAASARRTYPCAFRSDGLPTKNNTTETSNGEKEVTDIFGSPEAQSKAAEEATALDSVRHQDNVGSPAPAPAPASIAVQPGDGRSTSNEVNYNMDAPDAAEKEVADIMGPPESFPKATGADATVEDSIPVLVRKINPDDPRPSTKAPKRKHASEVLMESRKHLRELSSFPKFEWSPMAGMLREKRKLLREAS